MARALPPMNSLRAFEAAARMQSFTLAAEHLCISPAAVSQHVKNLEQYYGVALFTRTTRQVTLTPAGQQVFPALRDAFKQLHIAHHQLQALQHPQTITVSVDPSFAGKWLLPRLESFRVAYPHYDVRIEATNTLADFTSDNVDLALRCGTGNYPNTESQLLIADEAFPVCSPQLLDGKTHLPLEQLHEFSLIHSDWHFQHHAAPKWDDWLRLADIPQLPQRHLRFSMDTLAIQAAIDGMGIALCMGAFVVDDIAAGRLCRPFSSDLTLDTVFNHYLVIPKHRCDEAKIIAFRDWIATQVSDC